MDQLYPTETEAAWKQIAPRLDEALTGLGERDRDAVALRFFEQRSYREIGAALSLSEDNTRKRVSRALDRLRTRLGKRGCILPLAVMTAAISAPRAKAAPAELAGGVAKEALLGGVAAVGALPALVQATLMTLSWLRWQSLGLRTALGAVALALTFVLVRHFAAESGGHGFPAAAVVTAPLLQSTSRQTGRSERMLSGPQASTQPGGGNLLFRVVDAENQVPLAKARLTVTWITDFPDRLTNTFTSDAQGECLLPIDHHPVRNWSSRIEVFKDGYVPKYVSWSASQGDAIESIPVQYTTKLTRGTDIGGVVVDEQGEPVPDARVVFSVMGTAPGASHDRERFTMMGHYHTEITDSQGKWHCNHVPQQFGMITYECVHPLYLTARFGSAALGASTNLGMG